MFQTMHIIIVQYGGECMGIYDMRDIISIAKDALTSPTGLGDKVLADNSESWAPYLRFLGLVVAHYRMPVCLELGVYMATATMHMALGCLDTTVIGVDREFHSNAQGNVKRFPNIVLIEGDTRDFITKVEVGDVLPWNRLNKEPIGLIFLDSTHDGETPKIEFNRYKVLFAEECLVVCDDILGPPDLRPKMQEFWDWLPGEKQELHFLHPSQHDEPEPGFGVSIVKREDVYA